ncbi:hypothetical protein GE09DRAFT_1115049 [Coniochaeta sp. 2T2.1]|nr:hypothetical protein GE09DRAFT_1115049 [Coniochaeta sp. 2T2.1]
MPTTRAKAHSASNGGDDTTATAGTKHELADKNDQKTAKKQKTLEETVDNGNDKSGAKKEEKAIDQPKAKQTKEDDEPKAKTTPKKAKVEAEGEEKDDEYKAEVNGKKDDSATKTDDKSTSKSDDKPSDTSLSILEKGTIYFFLRGRVNVPSPTSISEIARTYILLRPNTTSTKARLLAVPKKTLPTSGRERWISFVEKTSLSLSDLQSSFLEGNEYETKTRGTQHTPAARPEGEGVYAIISKGRESHLVYLLTRPKELGEVQVKLGLKERGSWVVTTRNPEFPPPGGAGRLPEGPEFPEEVKKDFRGLRWAPTKPSHLDVEGAQVLLVGESSGIEKATEAPESEEKGGEDPKEELEELAEEDEKRMESLGEDDSEAIFKDLRADAEALPEMQSEFGE